METPPIIMTKIPEQHRRMSTTQLFTRIKQTSTRQLKTSKMSRAVHHTHANIKKSLSNSKQNLRYYDIMKKIQNNVKFDENKIASTYLLSLRKEYDKMSKLIKKQVDDINYMRKEVQIVRDKIKGCEGNIKDSGQKVQELKNQLQLVSAKQQQQKMQTKILDHVITRMKQDQLKHKTTQQEYELKLKNTKKQLKQKQEQIVHQATQIHKILEQMSQFSEEYKKNAKIREDKLQDYQQNIEELVEHQKFQQNRKERTYQLLSIESNDILDAKNVVLRDVLMTNKVLDKLLEGKINEMLAKYQGLQTCYHLIKTQTNISDPQLLAKKFFSYSQTLQQITQTIGYYEQRQQTLIQRNKQLKQKQKQMYIKKLEQQKYLINFSDINSDQKQSLVQQALEKELAVKKIRSWLDKIYDSVGLKKTTESVSPSEQIRIICEYAINKANEIKQLPKNGNKFQSPGIRLKKVVKQYSQEDDKIRRTQAQQVSQINIFENMNLNFERKQIKKNQFQIKVQPKASPKP